MTMPALMQADKRKPAEAGCKIHKSPVAWALSVALTRFRIQATSSSTRVTNMPRSRSALFKDCFTRAPKSRRSA
jgi:hypothetical protein